jgi:hypothetical protein
MYARAGVETIFVRGVIVFSSFAIVGHFVCEDLIFPMASSIPRDVWPLWELKGEACVGAADFATCVGRCGSPDSKNEVVPAGDHAFLCYVVAVRETLGHGFRLLEQFFKRHLVGTALAGHTPERR